MSVSAFAELTLEVADPPVVAAFYARAFGLREIAREEDRVWLAVGEHARLGLWSPGTKEFGDEGGAHVHFAFAVAEDDIDALAERARAAGGEVDGPHEHDGGDRSLYVTDPAGNVVEAWSYFDGGATVHDLRETSAGAA